MLLSLSESTIMLWISESLFHMWHRFQPYCGISPISFAQRGTGTAWGLCFSSESFPQRHRGYSLSSDIILWFWMHPDIWGHILFSIALGLLKLCNSHSCCLVIIFSMKQYNFNWYTPVIKTITIDNKHSFLF